MTFTAIGQRVDQIEQMLAMANGATPAATPASGSATTSFTQALQSAQGATATTGATTGDSSPYDADIAASAAKYGISPALLKGLIRQESGFDPTATSPAGAQGLTQLMPATAASLGVDAGDPAQAIDGGAHYLKEQLDRFGGDPSKALAAYNAGPGAVQQYGGVPPYSETQNYVSNVLAFAQQYGDSGTSPGATPLPVATTPVLAGSTGSALGYPTI